MTRVKTSFQWIQKKGVDGQIRELEQRIEAATNPRAKDGLKSVLEGLIKQLPSGGSPDVGNGSGDSSSKEEDMDEGDG
jgi:hypothetical protein